MVNLGSTKPIFNYFEMQKFSMAERIPLDLPKTNTGIPVLALETPPALPGPMSSIDVLQQKQRCNNYSISGKDLKYCL